MYRKGSGRMCAHARDARINKKQRWGANCPITTPYCYWRQQVWATQRTRRQQRGYQTGPVHGLGRGREWLLWLSTTMPLARFLGGVPRMFVFWITYVLLLIDINCSMVYYCGQEYVVCTHGRWPQARPSLAVAGRWSGRALERLLKGLLLPPDNPLSNGRESGSTRRILVVAALVHCC